MKEINFQEKLGKLIKLEEQKEKLIEEICGYFGLKKGEFLGDMKIHNFKPLINFKYGITVYGEKYTKDGKPYKNGAWSFVNFETLSDLYDFKNKTGKWTTKP